MLKQLSFFLIACSIFFIATTPFSSLNEHAIHILPLLGLTAFTALFAVYKSMQKKPVFEIHSTFLSCIAIFSLFLFVSSHVIPSHMLVHQHGNMQTQNHGEHPCCVILLSSDAIIGIGEIRGFVQEATLESKFTYTVVSIFNDSTRSPPIV